ncbi:MAG: 4Fe-4S binding protein [Syntrophomonadaceae bacterium]|nr:4Fe-4S binding protein [Syntrophomonadaceae bacterium]
MYIILKDKCSSCGLCADVCPTEAISPVGVYIIKTELCISCGLCQECCPSAAIVLRPFAAMSHLAQS